LIGVTGTYYRSKSPTVAPKVFQVVAVVMKQRRGPAVGSFTFDMPLTTDVSVTWETVAMGHISGRSGEECRVS